MTVDHLSGPQVNASTFTEVASAPGMSPPLVSVLMISYNQQAFVAEALDSVLAQDFRPLEIIIADDASTDGTADIIRDYAARYPDLIHPLFQPTNVGITANCNAALARVSGKYVAFLAGDDLMLPGKVAAQVALMEAEPDCVLSYHDLDVFHSGTDETLWLFSARNRPREGGLGALIRYGCFNGACATMVRRSAMPDHGFDSRIGRATDWLFWIETAAGGGTVRYIDAVLGRYRRHDGNVTGDPVLYPQLIQDMLFSLEKLGIEHPYHLPEIAAQRGIVLLSYGRRQRGMARFLTLGAGTLSYTGHWVLRLARLVSRPFLARGR